MRLRLRYVHNLRVEAAKVRLHEVNGAAEAELQVPKALRTVAQLAEMLQSGGLLPVLAVQGFVLLPEQPLAVLRPNDEVMVCAAQLPALADVGPAEPLASPKKPPRGRTPPAPAELELELEGKGRRTSTPPTSAKRPRPASMARETGAKAARGSKTAPEASSAPGDLDRRALEEQLAQQQRRIQELEHENARLRKLQSSEKRWAPAEPELLRKGNVIRYQLDLIDAWNHTMQRSPEKVAVITKVAAGGDALSFGLRCESGGVDFLEASRLLNLQEDAVNGAVAEVVREHGRVDVLVQAAGITGKTNIKSHEVDLADFQRVYDVNVKAIFLCAKAVLPSMLSNNYGRIVNIASISGKDGNAGMLAYSSSKAAVINLTKVMGKDYASLGKDITVNCIAPAVVQTAMVDAMPKEQVKYMTDKIPMGRTAKLDEVAGTVLYAASSECSFTTGFCFDASGGRTVY
ncbi:unnamed protein product [Effrenium voratum]|uniref:Uncharacterized protein n=1 Tax=Effrenium voratum TaxID=2562239 RepID=A0AA36IJP9_9DINO|nr:unnamed protein product [Effrenium voratum]